MKLILTFLLVCGLIISNTEANDLVDKVTKLAQECKGSTGASDADYENLLNYQAPNTDKGKCLTECVLKKSGALGENNKINEAVMVEFIKAGAAGDASIEKIGMEGLQACLKVPQHPNACENAAALNACFTKNLRAKGFKGLPA
ncbi:general odorant-binding protein 19d-like [Ceratitis capitata]|uniref:general odorant-binding protein 19d-like n=1 Tax=Ceratitis capitata TaxID=7213 RepID=UPI000C6C687E|nr:general odorant-binding protein 19d-like [Ceratitis capitata]XP_023158539.1 general odorant-binding protein 19d-like [Ceratitis capitata]